MQLFFLIFVQLYFPPINVVVYADKSIQLGYFIKHKHLISEECLRSSTLYTNIKEGHFWGYGVFPPRHTSWHGRMKKKSNLLLKYRCCIRKEKGKRYFVPKNNAKIHYSEIRHQYKKLRYFILVISSSINLLVFLKGKSAVISLVYCRGERQSSKKINKF